MKINVFEFMNRKAMRTDMEQFASGFSQYLPAITQIFRDKKAQKIRDRKDLQRDLLEEEEDKKESGTLLTEIDTDPTLPPEEKLRLSSLIQANKKGLRVGSKEQRENVRSSYKSSKESIAKANDQGAKDEKTRADKAQATKLKYDALKAEADALGPEAKKSLSGYLSMAEPNEVAVERFEKALERHYTAAGKKPDEPSQAEKDRATKERIIAMGDGDIERGMANAQKVDKDLFKQGVAAGIKFEGEDAKLKESATKLKDLIFNDYRKAVEDAAKYTDGEAPAKLPVYTMEWLDRFATGGVKIDPKVKRMLIDEVLNDPEGKGEINKVVEGVYGTGGKPSAAGGASPSAAPAVVSAGQEQSLIAEEERWKKLLDAAEQKYGIKK